jgi:hypothetical protein
LTGGIFTFVSVARAQVDRVAESDQTSRRFESEAFVGACDERRRHGNILLLL